MSVLMLKENPFSRDRGGLTTPCVYLQRCQINLPPHTKDIEIAQLIQKQITFIEQFSFFMPIANVSKCLILSKT